ncbi:alpha/beta hydrolase family protein [Oceanicoccus sagamiensis]|uniref:Dienelactone hydrolase n=1 Tax=Oceanicoccus sagamiensis TaxID=716816 RepID=A0A1X9NIH5_9GAMM|nr:hypothetical protein [Oceanicoccus sagamiensis]ARN73783.1 hypothetical protein BST96_06450 [Oceanicoccus sagamiensis]
MRIEPLIKVKLYFLALVFILILAGCDQGVLSGVGYQKVTVSDPVTNSKIEVALWYPTLRASRNKRLGPFIESLAVDAVPDDSNGLIVLSHGFAGDSLSHIDTAIYLAKHGFFVATPTHPDLVGLKSNNLQLDPLVMRPRVVPLLLDFLLEEERFKNTLAHKNIGILGYSIGAYTALSALGGHPAFDGLADYCNKVSIGDVLCAKWSKARFENISSQLNFERDTRIQAALLLAPGYGPLFDKQALSNVNVPIKIYSAEQDQDLPEPFHTGSYKNNLPIPPEHEVIANAGHFVFLAPCPDGLKKKIPKFCVDPDGVDREVVHGKINAGIVDFFIKTFSE